MTPEARRLKALEFQRAAEIATDESVQRAYRDLASKWHERAELAEALAQRLKGTEEGPLWSEQRPAIYWQSVGAVDHCSPGGDIARI